MSQLTKLILIDWTCYLIPVNRSLKYSNLITKKYLVLYNNRIKISVFLIRRCTRNWINDLNIKRLKTKQCLQLATIFICIRKQNLTLQRTIFSGVKPIFSSIIIKCESLGVKTSSPMLFECISYVLLFYNYMIKENIFLFS